MENGSAKCPMTLLNVTKDKPSIIIKIFLSLVLTAIFNSGLFLVAARVCISAVMRFRSASLSNETKRGTKIKTYSLHLTAPLKKHFVSVCALLPALVKCLPNYFVKLMSRAGQLVQDPFGLLQTLATMSSLVRCHALLLKLRMYAGSCAFDKCSEH